LADPKASAAKINALATVIARARAEIQPYLIGVGGDPLTTEAYIVATNLMHQMGEAESALVTTSHKLIKREQMNAHAVEYFAP